MRRATTAAGAMEQDRKMAKLREQAAKTRPENPLQVPDARAEIAKVLQATKGANENVEPRKSPVARVENAKVLQATKGANEHVEPRKSPVARAKIEAPRKEIAELRKGEQGVRAETNPAEISLGLTYMSDLPSRGLSWKELLVGIYVFSPPVLLFIIIVLAVLLGLSLNGVFRKDSKKPKQPVKQNIARDENGSE